MYHLLVGPTQCAATYTALHLASVFLITSAIPTKAAGQSASSTPTARLTELASNPGVRTPVQDSADTMPCVRLSTTLPCVLVSAVTLVILSSNATSFKSNVSDRELMETLDSYCLLIKISFQRDQPIPVALRPAV